mmetsp:Transcript_60591/g.160535  ORF Transcript_60591/g.160535 Transcript_60591/m.160535 type:complete len:213 (-) Transcript_60591:8-646(-)
MHHTTHSQRRVTGDEELVLAVRPRSNRVHHTRRIHAHVVPCRRHGERAGSFGSARLAPRHAPRTTGIIMRPSKAPHHGGRRSRRRGGGRALGVTWPRRDVGVTWAHVGNVGRGDDEAAVVQERLGAWAAELGSRHEGGEAVACGGLLQLGASIGEGEGEDGARRADDGELVVGSIGGFEVGGGRQVEAHRVVGGARVRLDPQLPLVAWCIRG